MDNLARKLDNEVLQQSGTVVRHEATVFEVRTDSGDYQAKRAVSCLVQPELGDVVLLATFADGTSYVLAVLERDDADGATNIAVDGDLQIRVPRGSFGVAAQEDVNLVSAKELSMVSGRFNVNAVDGNVVLQRLTYVGRFVRSEVEKLKLFAGALDSVLERFSQKVKRSYRTVEEFDQLRAERVDYTAKKTMSLHGKNTLMTAQELVKVDGEQIHLG